ncbi:MAG: glucose-1-phosphate thymidylyltransferase [Armatimonadota bacterium]
MKAVVLCAGAGTRLYPLTFVRPKHLLPVAGRAILDWVLSDLAAAGVEESVFVIGAGGDRIRAFVGDGSRWNLRSSFCVQHEPRGLAHALSCARPGMGDDERFLMYLGDDLLGDGVAAFAEEFEMSGAAASLIVKPVPDPREFGVVVCEDGAVTRAVEKPPQPPSDLAIVGVYGFGPEIWDAISSIEPSDRGELEITDAIGHLASEGLTVTCHVTEGFWADAGSPDALLTANRFYLQRLAHGIDGDVDGASVIEGDVVIAAGARITASTIRGPCRIDADSVIEHSTIGPHASLGAGCLVRGSTVSDSVLDDGCVVAEVRGGLSRSILGRGVTVSRLGQPDGVPISILAADETTVTADAASAPGENPTAAGD